MCRLEIIICVNSLINVLFSSPQLQRVRGSWLVWAQGAASCLLHVLMLSSSVIWEKSISRLMDHDEDDGWWWKLDSHWAVGATNTGRTGKLQYYTGQSNLITMATNNICHFYHSSSFSLLPRGSGSVASTVETKWSKWAADMSWTKVG